MQKEMIKRLLLLLLLGTITRYSSLAQTKTDSVYSILGGMASVEFPDDSVLENGDGPTIHLMGTAHGHRFVAEYYLIDPDIDTTTLLRESAQAQIDAAPENATVNYDAVQGPCYNGAQLSFELWTPITKPLGLLYSQARIYIIGDYFLSLSIQGLGRGVDEDEAFRFFSSLKVENSSEEECAGLD